MTQSANDLGLLTPAAKRELLARLLAQRESTGDVLAPCSHNQRSLWFMQELAPSSSQQNVTEAWRIRSPIDANALRRAIDALVARHEALRTTFEVREGEPWQRIHPRLPSLLELRDAAGLDDLALLAAVESESRRLFDLTAGPVIRATLFTRGPTDHVLLFTLHHIACDLWSIEHVHGELRELYGREIGAIAADVAPIPPPGRYRDFVAWQQAMLADAEGDSHWRYWRTKLGGPLPRLELPYDRPRPPVQSFARETVRFVLPSELIAAVRRRALEEETTLFTLFLTAFQCVLARHSGQDDILIGSAASGRSRHEFESIIGYFVSTIVFRADVSADPTFRELLRAARADVLATLEHQDFSLEMAVERLKMPRDASRAPVCDANVVWDKARDFGTWLNAEPGERQAHLRMDWFGTVLETYPLEQGGAPTDVGIVVFEIGHTISVNMWYATDLFDRSTIERLGEQFIMVLAAAAADPAQRVSTLPLLSPGERAKLLPSPVTADAFSDTRSLDARFADVAQRRGHAVAVSGAGGQLTYRELDERATLLAARLRREGVRPGDVVGLLLERDIGLAIGVVGILKAGAAYLPIDPSYPAERVDFMLRDSSAVAVVTQASLTATLPPVPLARVLIDDEAAASDIERTVVDVAASSDDTAYVIYTSGSTGRPKGVAVTHRNVARLFDSTAPWFAFGERDAWSLFHSIAFDFSVWELWGALLHGGRVVIVPHAITRSPDEFLQLLARERVTMLSQTPSSFRQLIAADLQHEPPAPLALRCVVFGGEALDVHALRPWIERRGDEQPRLINMYGITETTVHTTYRPITRADLDRRVRSPIGVPLPDLHLFVLDPAGEPVPEGVPGELYVGGAGVARGYVNRPELTEGRFVRDFTSDDPSARLYRSGDRVRRIPGGDLEFLGRIDHQVKIRGFRIELGEIEAVLSTHAAVEQCAVVVREDTPGDPRIVAYVVARAGQDAPAADLHAHLRRALPDYMLPGAFVRLPRIPLTANHKLDARALPSPDGTEAASTRAFVAPRSAVERELAAEWRRLLRVERVGVDDDFFELGGHSILATQVAAWIRSRYGIAFPVYAIFECPSVAALARRVEPLVTQHAVPGAGREAAREVFEL